MSQTTEARIWVIGNCLIVRQVSGWYSCSDEMASRYVGAGRLGGSDQDRTGRKLNNWAADERGRIQRLVGLIDCRLWARGICLGLKLRSQVEIEGLVLVLISIGQQLREASANDAGREQGRRHDCSFFLSI